MRGFISSISLRRGSPVGAKFGKANRNFFRWAFVLFALLICDAPRHASAHEGHDHSAGGHEAAPIATSSQSGRFSAQSASLELVAFVRVDDLLAYVDRADDNLPVIHARVTVIVDGNTLEMRETQPGVYVASVGALAPGSHNLAVAIGDGTHTERFAGTLSVSTERVAAERNILVSNWARGIALAGLGFGLGLVALRSGRVRAGGALLMAAMAFLLLVSTAHGHEGVEHGAPAAEAGPHTYPDGAVFLPKETQRLLGIHTIRASITQVQDSVEVAGRVIADPNGTGRLQAARDGRVEPSSDGFPHLGQAVKKGDVLAYVVPILTTSEESSLRQTLAQIDRDNSLMVTRSDSLGIVNPNMPMTEASASVLQELQIQAEGLQRQKEAVLAALNQKIEIKAPITGVISSVNVAAGQVAAARDNLFEIIDPGALLVEGWSFDPFASEDIAEANARLEDGRTLALAFLGKGPVLRQLATPLLFRVTAPSNGIDVGAPVRIFVHRKQKHAGIVLPAAAVARDQHGRWIVWEHATPETFISHAVAVRPADDGRVVVSGDVKTNMRLVVSGASLIAQAR